MALTPSIVQSGSNSRTTTAEEFNQLQTTVLTQGVEGSIGYATPLTGDSAVQAQGTPNKTVKILSGVVWMRVTPTGQSERMIRVPHGGLTSLTIANNTSGSTKYDKILLVLDADDLIDPPASGDFGESSCIITERHNAQNEAISADNAYELAEVTVANGFSSIANANIRDKRNYVSLASDFSNGGWNTYEGAKSYTSATRIAITSGDNIIFPVGTKIRYKQGGDWKYANVSANAAAYIDVTGGTDFTVANAPIDVLDYSYASSPVGFPTWFNWTPTLVGFSSDPPNAVYKFKIDGRSCTVTIRQGSNGTSNATNFTISAPIAAVSTMGAACNDARDNGATRTDIGGYITAGGSTITLTLNGSNVGWTNSGAKAVRVLQFTYDI